MKLKGSIQRKNQFPVKIKDITPSQTIMASFAIMILIGAFLLNLPIASTSGKSIGFLNALFTAVSANCVTGLVVVNTLAHWSVFGKIVILILIQLGGLGLVSILTFAMVYLGSRISLKNRLVIQASYNLDTVGGMVRLVKSIVFLTFLIELIGAILLTLTFYFSSPMNLTEAIYKGIFHSISAFCNAGFDIIGNDSLTPYQNNLPMNLIIMMLIILGGIGFPVLIELKEVIKNKNTIVEKAKKLSLHSKIALYITGLLILSGTVLFLSLEWNNVSTLGKLPLGDKILASLFQSVTLRTAGFNTISQGDITDTSQFFSCLFMLIGGSPAGTAGGIKTVTISIILISMISIIKGRSKIEIFRRTLSLEHLQKALTITGTIITVVLTATLLLHFTEANSDYAHTFMDLFFEASSAVGTVGITTGITPYLSSLGKIIIIICMFIGRLSPLTVVVALNMKLQYRSIDTTYPKEKVIIG